MKQTAIYREFKKLKAQIKQINEIVSHTKPAGLWEHEASVRKKLRYLAEIKNENIDGFYQVYDEYLDILENISKRLLDDYNKKNNTKFNFNDVIKENYNGYIKSGIIAVLITNHIPDVISKEFDKVFPLNPKDEYTDARKIKRKFIIHLGETNTGKTYNAMERLKQARKGIYLSPLRILALENYERLNRDNVICNLMTGEEEITHENATHISCTIEKLNDKEDFDIAVIDEIQMIKDDQRGAAWTRSLLGLQCTEIHICGALNARELLINILNDCGDEYEIIEYKRAVPLELQSKPFRLKEIEAGDALVVFSKKRVLELAEFYSDLGIKPSLIYGDLPPEVRKKQYEQFIKKETSILVTTDAIGMGVNLPIKRIVFMDIKKYDGEEVRFLNSQEVKQIAGRAGRIGIYDIGYVASYGDTQDFIREKIEEDDDIIEEAVLGPSEDILRIKNMSLREKLALWSTKEVKIPYYRKMDVSEYLIVLDSIKRLSLPEEIQWSLLRVPFDISSSELMSTFQIYVNQLFAEKSDIIAKPLCYYTTLYDLEIYYQRINMYYSFSKIFNLEFDEEWVYSERLKVSEKINKLLNTINFSKQA